MVYFLFHCSILLRLTMPKQEFYLNRESFKLQPNYWNATLWIHLNYFKYACTLKLKLYHTTQSQNICFDLFLHFSKSRIWTTISSFFLYYKTKTVIWGAGKKQKNYYLLSFEKKIYSKKWTRTFWILFCYEWETEPNNLMEENQNTLCL